MVGRNCKLTQVRDILDRAVAGRKKMGANRRRIEREVATERRWRHSRKPSEGDQAGDRHQRMAIERAQVDFPDQLAGRAPAGGVVPIRLSPGCWA